MPDLRTPFSAASRGELDPAGTWFDTEAVEPLPEGATAEFDLGQSRLLDASDATAMADVVGRALDPDRAEFSRPLTREEFAGLSDLWQGLVAPGKSAAERPRITEQTWRDFPMLLSAAKTFLYDGIVFPGDRGQVFVWEYNRVRNLPAKPQSPDYDRVEMAADEKRVTPKTAVADSVYLADDEYGANLMWMAALEHFRQNPDSRFVEVREHGGWFLGYVRDDGQIWGTANDRSEIGEEIPQPREFSGKTFRRDELLSAKVREAQRAIDEAERKGLVSNTQPQALQVNARGEPEHRPILGFLVVESTVSIGDTGRQFQRLDVCPAYSHLGQPPAVGELLAPDASGDRLVVKAFVRGCSEKQYATDRENTLLLQKAIDGMVADSHRYCWHKGAPRYDGGDCYAWMGKREKQVVREVATEIEGRADQINQAWEPTGDLHDAASKGYLDRINPARITVESMSLKDEEGLTVWDVACLSGHASKVPGPVREVLEAAYRYDDNNARLGPWHRHSRADNPEEAYVREYIHRSGDVISREYGSEENACGKEHPGTPNRMILYSESMGVYLGSTLGLGFWSKLDPVGQTEAVTFESEKEIQDAIATWDGMGSLPSDLRYLKVVADAAGYASLRACVAAGADPWSPEGPANEQAGAVKSGGEAHPKAPARRR